ncbi:MAG: hypothetical protein Kow0092_05300 [Deferrisomatales bacterium]
MAARNGPALGDPRRMTRVVFGCAPEEVAPDVIVTPFVPLKAFRRPLEGATFRELAPPFFYKGFTAETQGRRVTVILTGVGPSRVGDCLGFLALTPARRVLFAGAVGGLARGQAIGDWFLPTAAADGEGYTRYVARPFEEVVAGAPTVPADGALGRGVGPFLEARGWTVHRGPVFTVGSITFESRPNLEALARAGYAALEMELSAFYAAARFHGLDPAALTYVSDLPLESSLWAAKSPEEEAALRRAYRALPGLALEYLGMAAAGGAGEAGGMTSGGRGGPARP